MTKVCVLLSVYNGEDYLQSAIDSILSQDGVRVVLMIRDDGSTDRSFEIIKRLKYDNILIIGNREHLGVNLSYRELLLASANIDCDLIAFADQDDIWLSEKIKSAEKLIKASGKSLYSSARIVFFDYQPKQLIYPNFATPTSIIHCLFQNVDAGCTFVFTRTFRDTILETGILDISEFYDHGIAVLAKLTDEHYFDANSYILYRIHANNDIGINRRKPIKQRLSNLSRIIAQGLRILELSRSLSLKSTLRQDISQISLLEKGFSGRFKFVLNNKLRDSATQDMMLKFLILFKLYS